MNNRTWYYEEIIGEVLSEFGKFDTLTENEIRQLAEEIQVSHEMESTAFGDHNISDPREGEIRELKKQVERAEQETRDVTEGFRKNVARRWKTDESNVSFPDIKRGEAEVRVY